jgi:hypothetical protein
MNTAKIVVTRSPRWLASPQMTLTPAQYSKTQHRLLTTLGGLGVAALAAATFVLSYDDLRLLAIRGGAAHKRAFLYPGMIDGLVVVVVLAILTARRSGWFTRAVRWLLLLILVAGAGAAGVDRALRGYSSLSHTWLKGGVAAAPWVILVIAVWLWVSMIKQMLARRRRRSSASETVPGVPVDRSIIPGLGDAVAEEETRTLPRPAPVRELEPAQVGPGEAPALPDTEPHPAPWRQIGEPGPWADDAPDEELEAQADSWDAGREQWEAAQAEATHTPRHAAPDRQSPDTPASEREPEPMETAMNDTQPPEDDDPTPPMVARTTLPTDVRLVGGPPTETTHPDGIRLPDTQPDGIPIVGAAEEGDEPVEDERAEDPDAGEDAPDLGQWAAGRPGEEAEPTPPWSRFRSSPTPPKD